MLQAHVVNEDDDEEMETAQVQELDEQGQKEAEKRNAASSEESAPRPDLSHQPEIVESPKSKGVDFRSSSESGATDSLASEKAKGEGEGAELTDKSEDPTKAT